MDWIQGSRTTSDDCPYSIRPTGAGNASEDRRRSGSIERPTSGIPARQLQRLPVQPGRRRTGGLQLLVPVQCPGRPVGSTGKSSDTAVRLLGPLVGFQRVQGLGGRTTPTTGRNQPNPVGDLDELAGDFYGNKTDNLKSLIRQSGYLTHHPEQDGQPAFLGWPNREVARTVLRDLNVVARRGTPGPGSPRSG